MGKSIAKGGETKGGPKKKVWGTKQVLASPFSAQMPSPLPDAGQGVVAALRKVFPIPPRKRIFHEQQSPPQSNTKKVGFKRKREHSTNSLRPKRVTGRLAKGFLLGVNRVTKGLERNEIEMVVLARDSHSPILVSHIPIQCFTAKASLVLIPGNGTDIAMRFGVKHLAAFGITREAMVVASGDSKSSTGEELTQDQKDLSIAKQFIDECAKFAVSLNYPWLSAARGEGDVPPLPEPVMKPHESIVKRNSHLQKSTKGQEG